MIKKKLAFLGESICFLLCMFPASEATHSLHSTVLPDTDTVLSSLYLHKEKQYQYI